MKFSLDDSLGFILNLANTRMKNNLLHHFKEYNVTPEQWAILNRLWEKEGLSSKELAELTSKDQPTIVRMLSRLERKSLIIRQVNPEDSRAYIISLTNEGRAIKVKLLPLALEALNKAIDGIPKEELEVTKAVLNKIIKNLER